MQRCAAFVISMINIGMQLINKRLTQIKRFSGARILTEKKKIFMNIRLIFS
jgi:hypothetical protein